MSEEENFPTQFGIFYPTGYIVVAFPEKDDACKVQDDLMTGGYEESECKLYESDKIASVAKSHLEDAGPIATLGSSDDYEEKHLEAAKEGCTFLVIHAPNDVDAERVMRVVRRVSFKLAHRYHHLAIRDLK